MADNDPNPRTAARPAGADIDTDATSANDGERHPRSEPADVPPHPGGNPPAPLTTDSEAQQDDSVIQPDNS